MVRPLRPPHMPQSPGTWLEYFRTQSQHLSPEALGKELGVSGATIRRWEKGTSTPRDGDLLQFGKICGLSPHQIAFLRFAFSGFKEPMPPEREDFRKRVHALLTRQRTPRIIVDELMYIRAWNSHMYLLGPQVHNLLHKEQHPIERCLESLEFSAFDGATNERTLSRLKSATRSFWRFSAPYSSTRQYAELVVKLNRHKDFLTIWEDAAADLNSTTIDFLGIGELMLPFAGPKFSVIQSLQSFPPVYTVFDYLPMNDEAHESIAAQKERPAVHLSKWSHWSCT